jgi:hypothetical protein
MQSNYVPNPNNALVELPLGIHVVERRYTPQANAKDAIFQQDATYFKPRKDRFIAVRKAAVAEVDSMDATFWLDGALVMPPQAWVRVTRHPTLGHNVVLVWRGSLIGVDVDEQGYLRLESDDAVDFILRSMVAQGAANWPEMTDYLQKLECAKAIHRAQHTDQTQRVH